jgi:hypothetical protein
MKIGRLITFDGVEFILDSSQLRELTDYLKRQELIEAFAGEPSAAAGGPGIVDPEDYERAAQAAYFARQAAATLLVAA